MYGMHERINSDDIKLLDDYFKLNVLSEDCNPDLLILVKKIDLLVKQDDISRDAGKKITDLQDEIIALYKKEGEENVQK